MTISRVDLQKMFDDNGLDTYSASSTRLNHVSNGDVIVDSTLNQYLAPWSDAIMNLIKK
jgi:hypothetical protein